MKTRVAVLAVSALVSSSFTAQAFFEEGNDDLVRPGYLKCPTEGDLASAELTGCNPWPDADSSYSYKRPRDMKKSSVHYNATAALAVAAGFERCAAQVIASYAEATDVATEYDLELWVPFMDGTSAEQCRSLVEANRGQVADGLLQPGFVVAPDFTWRAFSRSQENEVVRESFTFHWNHTLTTLADPGGVQCSSESIDPLPVPPKDVLSLGALLRWTEGENPLNSCAYDPAGGVHGPIAAYHPEVDVAPGSLGSMGVFLHSLQDSYSHRVCGGNTHSFGATTTAPCGFVSGHYAGEFGVVPDGRPGSGIVKVSTPARSLPYRVNLHSDQTVLALSHTFEVLKTYLAQNPQYASGAEACSADSVTRFAALFAAIPNMVPAAGQPSGAKLRSDYADAFFASESCGSDVADPPMPLF